MRETYPVSTLYPNTAKEALEKWDKGEAVFTIQMGGLGPGYEQVIHILVFEFIRAWLGTGKGFSNEESSEYSKKTESVLGEGLDEKLGGVTGAQFGAAKSLAWFLMRDGWKKVLEEMSERQNERVIQVQKNFPTL